MPKKVRPKYGIDPVQEISPFSFANADIARLLNALAPIKGEHGDIITRLAKCAREYRWHRKQNQENPTRAEQNAALKEIGQLARCHGNGLRSLEMRLRNLDIGTESDLVTLFPGLHTGNFTDSLANFADALEHFAHAAKQALEIGKQKSGPRIQTHVQRTVMELAGLYEEFTGRRFSHNPKLLTTYDGRPHSRAGRFIEAFFKIVDPGIRASSLSTAMASIVKSRRPRQKAPPS
jgi:hypothetical protein